MLFALMAGCASTPSVQTTPEPKLKETIPLVSQPPGALVEASTGDRCTTPCELEVGWNEKISLSFQKQGFHTKYIRVRPVPEEISSRSVIKYASIGGLLGGLFTMAGDAIGFGIAAAFVSPFTSRELNYKRDKSLIAKGAVVGAVAGIGIGYGVNSILNKKRRRYREQVSVKLKPIRN